MNRRVVLLTALAVGAVGAAVAIPNCCAARKHGNEASAVGAVKTIATSESCFREGDKDEDGNLDHGMLSELANTKLVDSVLGTGTKSGYTFQASYSFTTPGWRSTSVRLCPAG